MTSTSAEELSLDPPLDFLRRLWRLSQSLEKMSSRMERELGITAQQRLVLRTVGLYPEITPGKLARTLYLDPGTISATISRLVGKGLLTKKRDETDARRYFLRLTRSGRSLSSASEPTVESAVLRVIERTPKGELAALRGVLERLSEELEESARRSFP